MDLIKLKGEQCNVLYLDRFSNQIILGLAGSGKSLEAVYRTAWISMSTDNNDKIAILSYNKSVCTDLGEKIKRISNKDNIIVSRIYSYCQQMISKYPAKPGTKLDALLKQKQFHKNAQNLYTALDTKNFKKQLHEIIANYDDTKTIKQKNEDFIGKELIWMLDNEIPNDDVNVYLSASRIGRGNENLSPDQRLGMYDIYQQMYQKLFDDDRLFFFQNIYSYIPDLDIPEEDKLKYIVVDEVQDLSKAMFTALRYLKKQDGFWNVFGDENQNIFGQRVSWRNVLGITVSKIMRLNVNYRNSPQINQFTQNILQHIYSLENSKAPIMPVSGVVEDQNTQVPSIINVNNLSSSFMDEAKRLSDHQALLVITMNNESYRQLKEQFKNSDIELYDNLKDYQNSNAPQKVLMQSINQVKGLEFDNVIVYTLDAYNPLSDRIDICNENDQTINLSKMDEDDQIILAKRIYVAASRAKKKLVMYYQNEIPSFLVGKEQLVNYVK